MRLDHLLSKENSADDSLLQCPRSVMVERKVVTLFNLEGALRCGDGGLAQLGERLPCKQEASGSIPLISTKIGLKCLGNGPSISI